jgi:hypothetical protein
MQHREDTNGRSHVHYAGDRSVIVKEKSNVLRFIISTFLLCGVALVVLSAQAGSYELAKYIPSGVHNDKSPVAPRNMALCRAYEANLNSFPQVKEPFVCERPINPKFSGFSKPDWKSLDPGKHIDLLLKIEKLQNPYRYKPQLFDEPRFREALRTQISQDRIRLKLAWLDIVAADAGGGTKPDGVAELVLRVERGSPVCNPADETWRRFPPVRDYFIVNEALTEIRVFADLRRKLDVFLYEGKVYFDSFLTTRAPDPDFQDPSKPYRPRDKNRFDVTVYTPIGNGVAPICRYRYVD